MMVILGPLRRELFSGCMLKLHSMMCGKFKSKCMIREKFMWLKINKITYCKKKGIKLDSLIMWGSVLMQELAITSKRTDSQPN